MKKVAIYARKSVESDKGDSVKNQIESCKEYLKLRTEEELSFIEYEDEGFTGGNTNRPDFQRLIDDIEHKKVDILICYCLDRITRSVSDFSSTLETLKEHNVEFISIKENFDTSTPMGRAMMYIASVFAQLERETIAERVKDNMYKLAKTDRWLGGNAPLGYEILKVGLTDPSDKKKTKSILQLVESEIQLVKTIFSKYIELKSMSKLMTYLLQNHCKTQNGKEFTTNQIKIILVNPTYVKADERIKEYYASQGVDFNGDVDGESGLMTYRKTKAFITSEGKKGLTKLDKKDWIVRVGTHPGVISSDDWLKVQQIIEMNKDRFPNEGTSHTALLSGLLKCACCGSPMRPLQGHILENGEKGYYYVCKLRRNSKGVRCDNKNARADKVDNAIINDIKNISLNKEQFMDKLRKQLKQGKQDVTLVTAESIQTDIRQKEKQIDNLTEKLSMDNAPVDRLFNGIHKLEEKIAELQNDLITFNNKKTKVFDLEVELDFVGSLLDKCSMIDELDIEEKKELINALFTKITWNSEEGTAYIEYIGSKKNEMT